MNISCRLCWVAACQICILFESSTTGRISKRYKHKQALDSICIRTCSFSVRKRQQFSCLNFETPKTTKIFNLKRSSNLDFLEGKVFFHYLLKIREPKHTSLHQQLYSHVDTVKAPFTDSGQLFLTVISINIDINYIIIM